MVSQIFTIKEYEQYLRMLPKKLESILPQINLEYAKSLQRRIRLRAPSGATGSLKNTQIKANSKNQLLLLGAGHWSYVNAGVAPFKWLPLEVAREHIAFPGSTAGKKVDLPYDSIDGWFFAGYTEGKGFVDKSMESLKQDIIKITERAMAKALSK